MAGPFESLAGAQNNPMHHMLTGLAEGIQQSNANELKQELKYRDQLAQQFRSIAEDSSYGMTIPGTKRTGQDMARDNLHQLLFTSPTDKLDKKFKLDKNGQVPALTEVMYHKQMAKGPDAVKQPPEPSDPNVGLQAPPQVVQPQSQQPPMTMTDLPSDGSDNSGLLPPPSMGLDGGNVSAVANTVAPPAAPSAMAAAPGGVQPMPGKIMPGPAVGAPPDANAGGGPAPTGPPVAMPPPAAPTGGPPAAAPPDPNDPYAGMASNRMTPEDQARQTAKLDSIKNSRPVFGKVAQMYGVADGTMIDARDGKALGQLSNSQSKMEIDLRKKGMAGVYDPTNGTLLGTRPLENSEMSKSEQIHNSYMGAHEGLLDAQTKVAEANATGIPEKIAIAKGELAIRQRQVAVAEKALAQGASAGGQFGGIFGGGAGGAGGAAAGAQPEIAPTEILNKLSQPDRAAVVAVLEGRGDPKALSMRSSGKGTLSRRDYVLSLAHSVDPTYNEGDYPAMQKVRTSLVSGADHNNIISINTLIDHLVHFKHNAAALDNSDVQLWNDIANKGISAVGDPRVRKLNMDATAVSNELAAMFKRGMGTDQEIKAWRENFNAADSPAKLEAAWQEGIQLMIGRASTIANMRDANLNKFAAAKIPVFFNRSRALLSKELGIDGNAVDSVSGAGMSDSKSFSGAGGGLTPPPNVNVGGKQTVPAAKYDAAVIQFGKAQVDAKYTRGQ